MPTETPHTRHRHPAIARRGERGAHPTARAVALALFGAAMGSAVLPTTASAQATAGTEATGNRQSYRIAAGPLAPALRELASAAHLALSFTADQTDGRTTAGIQGVFTPQAALSALLDRTGLQALRLANGGYVLRALPATGSTGADTQGSTLPVVNVVAAADRETATGPVAGYVATRSATGTKTDTPLVETPRAVSVITRQQLDDQKPTSIVQAIGYTAGVFSANNPYSTDSQQIALRGFTSTTGTGDFFYRDGMRIATIAFTGRQSVEPYALERIEVLRGPASVLFGQNVPGGIVNLVSKQPTDMPLREVEVQVGSFNRKQVAADFSGPIDDEGKLAYRLIALKRDADTQTDYLVDQRDFLSGTLAWRPTARTDVTLRAEYQRNKGGGINLLPASGTVLYNPNGQIPVSRAQSTEEGKIYENADLAYQLEHRASDVWTFRQSVRYSKTQADAGGQTALTGYAANRRNVSTTNTLLVTDGDQWSTDNQAQARFTTGAVEHTLLFGLDHVRGSGHTLRGDGPGGTLDLFAPVYGPVARPAATGYDQNDLRQTGVYVQEQLKIDKAWVLSLGGRHDGSDYRNERQRASNTVIRMKDSAFTGQAGLLYLSESGFAPYVSYATSFMPVTSSSSFDGTPFEPEEGQQYEAGVKYQSKDGSSFVTMAIFDLRKQNVGTTDPAHPLYQIQTGEVRSRGLELEAKATLGRRWSVTGSYSYTDAKVTKDNTDADRNGTPDLVGKAVPNAPRHLASAWVDYAFGSQGLRGLSLGGGLRHIGERYGNNLNTWSVSDVTLFDLALRYDLGQASSALRGAVISLNISNLADKIYAGYCNNSCQYGARRTAIASLRYRW